jgi:S-adenosylmethionine:tRNA ribosyltransferase-isomerase
LLLRREHGDGERWWCLLKPGRKLPNGSVFGAAGDFEARVVSKSDTAEYLVEIRPSRTGESVVMLAERIGIIPLPPYIHRSHDGMNIQAADAIDRNRYQTVFADQQHTVAVAAPTAGLHFTKPLLDEVSSLGVYFADVVLHVGLGTFRPIETDDIAQHPIHREIIEVPPHARRLIHNRPSGRRIAVGTTSVRTMEFVAKTESANTNATETFVGEADLFIYPPYSFGAVDALITNFHLPRSTLLCLVAAFLAPGSTEGVAWLREIYSEAIRERYRFLSYGDAMLII